MRNDSYDLYLIDSYKYISNYLTKSRVNLENLNWIKLISTWLQFAGL